MNGLSQARRQDRAKVTAIRATVTPRCVILGKLFHFCAFVSSQDRSVRPQCSITDLLSCLRHPPFPLASSLLPNCLQKSLAHVLDPAVRKLLSFLKGEVLWNGDRTPAWEGAARSQSTPPLLSGAPLSSAVTHLPSFLCEQHRWDKGTLFK